VVAIVLATEVHIQLPVSCGLECIVSIVGEEVMHTLRMKAKLKQTRKTKCFTVSFNAKLYIILCKVEPGKYGRLSSVVTLFTTMT